MIVHVVCETSKDQETLARNAVASETHGRWPKVTITPARLFDDQIRQVPYLKDIIDQACSGLGDSDSIVFTNADICFYQNKLHKLEREICEGRVVMSHRIDVSATEEALYPGYDLFAFTVRWWKDHRDLLVDLVIGTEYWDACFKELIKRTKSEYAELNDITYHHVHNSMWCRPENIHTLASQIHNRTLAREFFRKWSEIDYLELAKIDPGTPGSGDLYFKILGLLIGDASGKSLIDLCCGEMTGTRHLGFKESVHVDVADEPLRPPGFNFVQCDVLSEDPVFNRKYDVALCLDGIEHLTREDGLRLADRMTNLAKLSIIFTPLGFYKTDGKGSHAHLSGWLPADLPGWETLVFPNWHPTLGIGALFFYRELVDDSTT